MTRLRHSTAANAARWLVNFRGQRVELSRRYLFDGLARVTPVVAIDADGMRFYLSTRDKGVGRSTFATRDYEGVLFERVLGELRRRGGPENCLEGNSFLDIGANIGTSACFALCKFGASSAWAFEPEPQNLALLRQNLLANGLEDRVRIAECALSDRDATVDIGLSGDNWGDHRVQLDVEHSNGGPSRRTVPVASRRLDSFVEDGSVNLDDVGLAWIDVQGHEGHVLAGAEALLDSEVPIVCEYWPEGLGSAEGLDRFHEAASRRSQFLDLMKHDSVFRPATELPALEKQYRGETYTNVLLVR